MDRNAAPFSVLFVSTGNVCRSPMAERLAERNLTRMLGAAAEAFPLSSAGTWGHDGAPMEQHARTVLTEEGARITGFVARELLPEQIAPADLVLTASAEQRHQVRLTDPQAAERAFTLREFAWLARAVDLPGDAEAPTARARALVDAVTQLRRRLPSAPYAEDIADPYGAPLHVFRVCAAEIVECLTVFVEHVATLSAPQPGRAVG
jgi:protein-tyrosine phosphatase